MTIHTLPNPIAVRGFDGESRQDATQYIILYLHIDGRKQYNVPMVLLDTGYQDLILGRTWFDYLNVQLNPRLRQLVWPPDLPESPNLVKIRLVDPEDLRPKASSAEHQADADRHDRALAEESASDQQTDPLPSVSLLTDRPQEP